MVQFGDYGQLSVGPEGLVFEGKQFSYHEVNDFAYSDTVYSVNGMPNQEVFKIYIHLRGGEKIKVVEKADARPTFLRTPITKLFKTRARKEYKAKLSEERLQSRKAYLTILTYLTNNTGMEGENKKEWF